MHFAVTQELQKLHLPRILHCWLDAGRHSILLQQASAAVVVLLQFYTKRQSLDSEEGAIQIKLRLGKFSSENFHHFWIGNAANALLVFKPNFFKATLLYKACLIFNWSVEQFCFALNNIQKRKHLNIFEIFMQPNYFPVFANDLTICICTCIIQQHTIYLFNQCSRVSNITTLHFRKLSSQV